MKRERPKNLDLTTITLPVTGVASILHRISAVVIWFSMMFFLPVLYISLSSESGFQMIKSLMTDNFIIQFLTWGFLTALGYYIAGGMKHLIQEMGHFETLEGGRFISQAAIGIGIILSILSGVWIWV